MKRKKGNDRRNVSEEGGTQDLGGRKWDERQTVNENNDITLEKIRNVARMKKIYSEETKKGRNNQTNKKKERRIYKQR